MVAIRSFHAFNLQEDEKTDQIIFVPQPGKPAGVLPRSLKLMRADYRSWILPRKRLEQQAK